MFHHCVSMLCRYARASVCDCVCVCLGDVRHTKILMHECAPCNDGTLQTCLFHFIRCDLAHGKAQPKKLHCR